jgi:hypothetical protein
MSAPTETLKTVAALPTAEKTNNSLDSIVLIGSLQDIKRTGGLESETYLPLIAEIGLDESRELYKTWAAQMLSYFGKLPEKSTRTLDEFSYGLATIHTNGDSKHIPEFLQMLGFDEKEREYIEHKHTLFKLAKPKYYA